MATGKIVNVGSAENPALLDALHVDLVDYGARPFLFGDACALPFPDKTFDTAVYGDCLEHILDPGLAIREGVRVARTRLVLTIPKDTRFPPGQHVEEANALDADRNHPTINCFSDEWLHEMIDPLPVTTLDWIFVPEHNWMNWLITLEVR
jgi:ubiquinone/menaquinone biosynthesis C-methylase UbiE